VRWPDFSLSCLFSRHSPVKDLGNRIEKLFGEKSLCSWPGIITDRENTKHESCRDEISDKKPRPGHNQALIKNGGMPE